MPTSFEQFCQTIASLRGPQGCPWDREQNHKTLIRYLLEETYEVLEAINADDFDKLKEELGDLLLQIVLQAQLGSEKGNFNIEDIIESINKKMIGRHPHVFSTKEIKTSEEVLNQWEQLKESEKSSAVKNSEINKKNGSALANIPSGMPALLKALKISERAVNQGFEWEKENDIWHQLESELEEFKLEAEKQANNCNGVASVERKSSVANEDLYLEMGDVLFTMVNIARWHKIDPEEALLMTIEKFKKRFQLMENMSQRPLKELTLLQLDSLWKKAKEETKAGKPK
jgi:tetrapyrrole methylase family protein/MazG family protein